MATSCHSERSEESRPGGTLLPENPGVRLCFEENPQQTDIDKPSDALSTSNIGAVGVNDYQPLALFLRDAEDNVVGGLSGATYGGCFHLELLWIRGDLRGQGYGDRLLALAEQEAARRGCRRAYLSTFDFQAPDFYAARGYEVFGTLPDFPPGHAKHSMVKSLATDSPTEEIRAGPPAASPPDRRKNPSPNAMGRAPSGWRLG